MCVVIVKTRPKVRGSPACCSRIGLHPSLYHVEGEGDVNNRSEIELQQDVHVLMETDVVFNNTRNILKMFFTLVGSKNVNGDDVPSNI